MLAGIAKGELRLLSTKRARGGATVTRTQSGTVVAVRQGRDPAVMRFPRSRRRSSVCRQAELRGAATTSELLAPRCGARRRTHDLPLPPRQGTRSGPDSTRARGAARRLQPLRGRTPSEVGLTADVVRQDGIPTARLGARDHAAASRFPRSSRGEDAASNPALLSQREREPAANLRVSGRAESMCADTSASRFSRLA